jgi:glycosyltransferase involved in cell wall biosynthesis
MHNTRHRICWITPDYFLNVDAKILPRLIAEYSIDWILIRTCDSQRTSDGLLPDGIKPQEYRLTYRQRDPRVILQYAALLSSIRKGGYDLVYTSFHGLPYFLPLLRQMIDPDRFIYAVHNVETPRGASNERLMRLYHHYAFRVFKRFHVFSRYQLRAISEKAPGKRHYYAPLAPDDYGRSDVRPPRDTIRFLFFGYIRRYKRLDLLIKAFDALHASGIRNVELLIAGRCDDWEHYEALIDRRKGIVTRIGIVSNDDIPDLVSSSHYVVMPYQDGAQSAVLALAYHYNRPVITSDIAAFADVVVQGCTGFRFVSESHESLASVMKEVVLRHDDQFDTLTRNVAAHVTVEWSVDDIVARYRGFLDESLHAGGLPQPCYP